ncbi:hypothetical protein [Cryobacterium sp. MLB-32]|uniref:hypothetical protein n=1 Tax=Cryobacterium sp. MLB-32 TaxID=1529318 RepID=UPI00068E2B72|nr:hypothetical protein [Cryobacterium sp. MLB-32]
MDSHSELLRQANLLYDAAQHLAHRTRVLDRPSDSYDLLGCLTGTQRLLSQVYGQLARWHGQVIDGVHHNGEDGYSPTPGDGVARAEVALHAAAQSAVRTEDALMLAYTANGVVCWFDGERHPERL